MKSASYGWIEAAIRYAGRFGPREKMTYQDVFQLSAPSVSRHQEFVANTLEEATETELFQKKSNGHLKGGKLLLLENVELPSSPVFARVPPLEIWLQDTFGDKYFHHEGILRNQADADIVRPIISSIIDNKPLRVEYHESAGIIWRTISPHAIFKIVGRFHLRAFDHFKNGYRDYLLSRISQVQRIDDGSIAFFRHEHDHEWAMYATLEVRERTNLNEYETNAIRMDYGLEETGIGTMKVPKPLVPYLIETDNDGFKSPVNVVPKATQ